MRNAVRGTGIALGAVGLGVAGLGLVGVVGAGAYVLQSGGRTVDAGTVAQRNRPTPTLDPVKADALVGALGPRTAGAFVDAAGRMVVTITDAADAARVRAAGAVPKMVPYGRADLDRVTAGLRSAALGPGTGWGLDARDDAVTVWADSTVTGARMRKVTDAMRSAGRMVRLQRLPGRLRTLAGQDAPAGGDAIFGGNVRCSLGFNAHQGTRAFFVTAGHCGNAAKTWSTAARGGRPLGDTVKSTFPGHDFSLVSLTTAGPSAVDLFNGSTQQITRAADPVVGEKVSRSGSTTGVHTGTVTALGATVNFAEGTVTGMIETTVCAEPGDSGGPLFAGTTALGLTSGGNGDCTVGGTTFFQPIVQALQTLGVQVGTAAGSGSTPTTAPSRTGRRHHRARASARANGY
jgi:streptogrisin D